MAALGELYLLAAYLAIGLMSITVPTYAIAVTYLARETSESRKDLQKRRKELAEKLEQLKKKLEDEAGVASISEEIKKYEKEDERLKGRQLYLSVKGAVALPFASFLLALIVAAYGYYSGSNRVIPLFLLTSMGMGLFFLTKSLLAIEQAAMRPEEVLLPALKVSFDTGANSMSFKAAEQKEVVFLIENQGEEFAEMVNAMFLFGPEFEVSKGIGYTITKQGPTARYPNYNGVSFNLPVIHAHLAVSANVGLKLPDKPGSYLVPVAIRAKKIERLQFELYFVVKA